MKKKREKKEPRDENPLLLRNCSMFDVVKIKKLTDINSYTYIHSDLELSIEVYIYMYIHIAKYIYTLLYLTKISRKAEMLSVLYFIFIRIT